MGCSLPGSSVHGIFQARVLEWVAISFSKGSSQPRDRTQVSRRQTLLLAELPGKPLSMCIEMQIPDALKSKNSFTQFWHLFWGDNPLVLAHPLGIRDGYLYLKYICLHFWPCCLIEK